MRAVTLGRTRVPSPVRASKVDNAVKSTKAAKLLVITSSKGGSSKTTTARNLAVCAAQNGLKVATIDIDAQPTLSDWHRARPPEAPVIAHKAIRARGSYEKIMAIVSTGDFDVVIVDTPPGVEERAEDVRMLIRVANFVILPTQQQDADLNAIIQWSQTVERENAPYVFLLSRTFRNRRNFGEAKQRLIDVGPLCPFDVRDLASVDNTQKMGIGNAEVRGDQCGEDFRGVWRYVARELGLLMES